MILFKKFTRVFVVQHILTYLELDEALALSGVCVYFNSLIKSTFFIRYMVAMREKTKIDISLDAFNPATHTGTPEEMVGKALGSSVYKAKKEESQDELIAQLDVLRNVKEFLKT